MSLLDTLWSYWTEQRRTFASREELEAYQTRALGAHLRWLSLHSVYFNRRLRRTPDMPPRARLATLPVVDKVRWLASFNRANTGRLNLEDAMRVALHAEKHRDFRSTLKGCTVGLSSGTSGPRGVFAVSRAERSKWAGVILAKLLPRGLFAKERVAFFLRANSNLYTAVNSRWLTFKFFDLFEPFSDHLAHLAEFKPTIIVAPAQVLRALALNARPELLANTIAISVAEVLDDATHALLKNAFSEVKQVYQATEGLLATTCEHGHLHLNEEHLVFEKEWLDEHRFVPLVTDFSRRTQPVVRYRLNDILRASRKRCTCGRHSEVIEAIEGRFDDQLSLPGVAATQVNVFADPLSRVLALALPQTADYQLTQTGPADLSLATTADAYTTERARDSLASLMGRYGVDVDVLNWSLAPATAIEHDLTLKRRRVRNDWQRTPPAAA